jgi:hypothetical protein
MYCICSKRTRAEQNIIFYVFQRIKKLLFAGKRIMDCLGNLLHRKRLWQEGDIVETDCFAQLFLGIARHKEQPNIAELPAQVSRHRRPVHIGHHHVRNDQIVTLAIGEQGQRLLAVARGLDDIALSHQRSLGDCANHVLVLYDKHPPAAPKVLGLIEFTLARVGGGRLADMHGQIDIESRALTYFRFGKDKPARLLDDAVDG